MMSLAKLSALVMGQMRMSSPLLNGSANRQFWTTTVTADPPPPPSPPSTYSSSLVSGAPKRPLSAFFRFMQKEVSTDQPRIEQAREAGKKWNELTEDEKKPYADAFQQDFKLYSNRMGDFKAELEKDGKLELFEASAKADRREKNFRRVRNDIKKLEKEMAKPKKTSSGYNLFVAEQTKGSTGRASTQLKEASKKWVTLGEDGQKSYMNRASDNAANREAEKNQWMEKMEGTEKMEALMAAQETMRVLKRKMKQEEIKLQE